MQGCDVGRAYEITREFEGVMIPLYYPGYSESRATVKQMPDEQLLAALDDLRGRDNLPANYTHDDLLAEALSQHREEWTDKTSHEYEQVTFWVGAYKAQQLDRWGVR